MALCGNKCMVVVNESDALKCACCGVKFHSECVKNIQFQLAKDIVKWKTPNVQFRCDKCVNKNDSSVKALLESMSDEIMKKIDSYNDDRFNKLMEKIENIEKTLNVNGKKVVEEISKVVEESKIEASASWAQVVNKKKKKKQSDPVVIITPKNKEQDRLATKKSLKSTIDPAQFTVKGFSNASNNGVMIRCENDDDCAKLMSEAEQKMGDGYEFKKPCKRQPRFKILKVDQPEENDEKFISELRRQNPIVADEKYQFEIVAREPVRINGKIIDDCFNIVLQSDGETFNVVMASGSLKTKWKVCRVVDNVWIRRCYRCLGFHSSKDCKSPIICALCGSNHLQKECNAKITKCINCVKTNERSNAKLLTNHNAWSKQCPVYKLKLEKSKRAINYID